MSGADAPRALSCALVARHARGSHIHVLAFARVTPLRTSKPARALGVEALARSSQASKPARTERHSHHHFLPGLVPQNKHRFSTTMQPGLVVVSRVTGLWRKRRCGLRGCGEFACRVSGQELHRRCRSCEAIAAPISDPEASGRDGDGPNRVHGGSDVTRTRGETMSWDRAFSNLREPERGAETSGGAVVSTETNRPGHDRDSEEPVRDATPAPSSWEEVRGKPRPS